MRIEFEHFFSNPLTLDVKLPPEFLLMVASVNRNLEKLIMTQAELSTQLRSTAKNIEKSIEEIKVLQGTTTSLVQKVDELQKIIAEGGEITSELKDAADEVARLASQADNEIPDIISIAPGNIPPEPEKEEVPEGHSSVFGDKTEDK